MMATPTIECPECSIELESDDIEKDYGTIFGGDSYICNYCDSKLTKVEEKAEKVYNL